MLVAARGGVPTVVSFSAVRFLSVKDHVLDCERTHAVWQWLMLLKRGMGFAFMNALLKTMSYSNWNCGLPSAAVLQPHLETVRAMNRRAYLAAVHDSGAAVGSIVRAATDVRYNMRPMDIALVRAAVGARPAPAQSAAQQRGMYVR